MVAEHSFKRATGSMQVQFAVTDGDAQMPVVYTGILPDLFRENQAVIATGHMRGDTFVAEQVLAKHDETYVPKEVADRSEERRVGKRGSVRVELGGRRILKKKTTYTSKK